MGEYIGNPDLDHIKPYENYRMNFNDLQNHIQRPIIFLGLGDLKGQKELFEASPAYEAVLKLAAGLNASIRFFNPNKDSKLIGNSDTPDYFIPLSKTGDEYFDFLQRTNVNVKKMEIQGDHT